MEQQPQPGSEIILYQTEDGHTRLEVKLENNTVWLSLNQIAELFQRDKTVEFSALIEYLTASF
jgi:hypothetical protein